MVMTQLTPTSEQQDILDAVATGGTVAISACAGTGKTSTLRMIAERSPERRMLYIAFNKGGTEGSGSVLPEERQVQDVACLGLPALRCSDERTPGRPLAHRLVQRVG